MLVVAAKCRVSDCPRMAQRRYYCWTHYNRIRRYGGNGGDPDYIGKWGALEDRFNNAVQINGPLLDLLLGACHQWTGHAVNGYGRIGFDGRQIYVHRLAYEWAHGPIPPCRQVTQRCGNTLCVRADHLQLRRAIAGCR